MQTKIKLTSGVCSSRLVALVLISLFALASNVGAQTTITSLPTTINVPGRYVLNSNLSYALASGNAITIAASNVTLDFQGHLISGTAGPATNAIGVRSDDRANITLKNGTVTGFFQGILCNGTLNTQTLSTSSVNNVVQNMRSWRNYAYGIRMTFCQTCRVEDCQVTKIGGRIPPNKFVGIETSDGSTIRNNQVSEVAGSGENSYGILTDANNFIVGNTIERCGIGVRGGRWLNNLTLFCAIPFVGSTESDAGHNH